MMIQLRLTLIFLAGMLPFTPPGLCGCWLIPQVETVHVHVSSEHAKSDHTHTYLLQISQTLYVDSSPLVLTPVSVWISITGIGGILLGISTIFFREGDWLAAVPIPPPKVFS